MRISMLFGAAMLAVPMAADAALYRFSYESGPTTFVGDQYSFTDGERTRPITADVVLDITSIYNLDYSASFVQGEIFGETGGTYVSANVDGLEVIDAVAFGDLSVGTDGSGNLTGIAATAAYDSTDAGVWGSYSFIGQGGDLYYEAQGEWTVSLVDTAPVPLPATAPLLLASIAALGWYRRRS